MVVSKRSKVVNNVPPPPPPLLTKTESILDNTTDFPEWLLIELLVRLSSKHVHTSKIISKQWLSLISDPFFVRQYISRRPSSLMHSHPWTFLSPHMHHVNEPRSPCLEFSRYEVLLGNIYSQLTKPSYHLLPLPITQQSNDGGDGEATYTICGVSNGLVLYRSRAQGINVLNRYYICNPVTGKWFDVPKYKWRFREESVGFLTQVEDGILKSFRVVRLEVLSVRRKKIRFDEFSSETRKWNKFIVPMNLEIWHFIPNVATEANGILYWTINKIGIIAYDPYLSPQQVHTIPLPVDIMLKFHAEYTVLRAGSYEGKLRYFEVSISSENQSASFKLWELNDHVSGDWNLLYHMSSMDINYIYDANPAFKASRIRPLSFHPFNLDVVYLGWDDALVSYNMRTGRLEVEQKCCRQHTEKTPKQRPDWWSSLLLVISSWPTSLSLFLKG